MPPPTIPRILFIRNSRDSFIKMDMKSLRMRYRLTDCRLRSHWINPISIWRQVSKHDVVCGWFASWHVFLPLLFARLQGRPSLLIIGGYDLANMPDIGYGHQRGGLKKWVSRWNMKLASSRFTNSQYSRDEAQRNAGISDVAVIYHGVPDPFGALPDGPRARIALTVGNVDRANLWRKGHEPFVRAAALCPDVHFVLVGKWRDDAIHYLRSIATSNVTFTGRLDDAALQYCYRRASVYVQASAHEGFGLAVAEAMLAGCIPVVTRAGALPEVVGEAGVYASRQAPAAIAQAVQHAFTLPETARLQARQRVLEVFPMAKRNGEIERLIEELLARHSQPVSAALLSR